MSERDKFLEMKADNEYLKRIKDKIGSTHVKNGMPLIFNCENGRTTINCQSPNLDFDRVRSWGEVLNMIPTNKFILKSYGDWQLFINMVKSSHFLSRKNFDEVINERTNFEFERNKNKPKIFSWISMIDVFQELGVTIRLNVEEILKSATPDQKEIYEMKFWTYVSIVELFGKSVPMEGQSEHDRNMLHISDFHCYHESNFTYGIGIHGDFYLYFEFCSS